MIDAVPFEMPNNIPFVVMEAKIGAGAHPARVLLDTGNGAPYDILISPGLAERAGAVAQAEGERQARGAVGDAPVTIRPASVANFALGPVRLPQARAGVSTLIDSVSRQIGQPIDGIVGHRFVAGRTVSIDYGRRRVDFTARAGRPADAVAFTIAPSRPLTLVHVTINGRGPFLMALDTGASTTLLSPALASAAGIETGQSVQLGGAGGTAAGGARIGRARIGFGTLTRDGQQVAVADVLAPIQRVAGARIEGVLGADMFGAGRITLDYGSNRLWFEERTTRG
ncbi:MAG TPA: pepsin/retropepsin-like aspartic protease family protein [Allosphingosinicella sp.]|nr:pepsin/retropepsin-like aspartic protease family protein [Allosphingosinicella sp.]